MRRHSAIATALAALAVLALPAGARAETLEQFCQPAPTTRPTAEMLITPRSGVPVGGKVVIGAGRGKLLLAAGFTSRDARSAAPVGRPAEYGLSLVGGKYRVVRLGWSLEARVSRLDSGRKLVSSAKRRIGKLRKGAIRRVRLPAASSPGLYRYDLIVRDGRRKVRGHFQFNKAVLSSAVDVRLATFGEAFRVGDQVSARIENRGSSWASYGAGASFDRLEDGAWVRQDFEALFGHLNAVPAIGLTTPGGFTSDCQFMGFTVPAGMTPGRYRMVKDVTVAYAGPPRRGTTFPVAAEFTVD